MMKSRIVAPLVLALILGPTGPAISREASDEIQRDRQRAAEALIAADPLVRRLVAEHAGARIQPGSVRPL